MGDPHTTFSKHIDKTLVLGVFKARVQREALKGTLVPRGASEPQLPSVKQAPPLTP